MASVKPWTKIHLSACRAGKCSVSGSQQYNRNRLSNRHRRQERWQVRFFVTAEIEFGFVVGTQQIGVYLFADYLIGDGEFGPSFIRAANGEHTEIVEQAHKVVGIGDIDSRKTFFSSPVT